MSRPVVSVVIPLHDEEPVVPQLFIRLGAALRGLRVPAEIVAVDDGSRDGTWAALARARRGLPRGVRVRLVRLSRNFGQQAAITAGLDFAAGRAVAVMDADLQDPPELLSEFVRQWRKGAEVVYGVREKRREGLIRRAAYHVYYRILSRLSAISIPRDAGDFCLMDRKVVDLLRRMPERNRFLRGLRAWAGFRQSAVAYARPARAAGQPAYSWGGLVRLALDGIASFSYVPLRVSAILGAVTAAAGIGFAAFAVWVRLFWTTPFPAGWASLIVLISVLGGTQLVALGIIGEYLARVYDEAKQRPSYVVRDLLP